MEANSEEGIPPGDCTGANRTFLQLLADVGGISPQNITRSQDPLSQPRNFFDSIEYPTVREFQQDRDYATTDSETDGEDDLSRVLPCEDGELFDYEYNLSEEDIDDEEDHKEQEHPVDLEDAEEHEDSATPGETADEEQTPWKKRKRHQKGVALPNCRKSIGLGAVEIAMRKSGTRTTANIFEPSIGMTFDSIAEAHNFYNLYSWEVGFGIRRGRCHKNGGNKYRTMQGIECCNAGTDQRVLHKSMRYNCKAMIKLHRTEDHGWYISRLETEHNHPLATGYGEKMQWRSHNHIDTHTLDLNDMPPNVHMSCTPFNKISLIQGRMAKNPWFYGIKTKKIAGKDAETFYNWLAVTTSVSLDSLWVKHEVPKEINVHGNDMKSVFTKGYNFTEDLLDMAIRRFGQTDVNMYGEGVKLRWIHPFESDFSARVLNGEDFLQSKSVQWQLTGREMDYDISNCRMVAVPHLSGDKWTAYFWDMKERVVHVVDPTFDIAKACELHELHGALVEKLQEGLVTSFAAAYDGWRLDWSGWKKNYVEAYLPGKQSNESGLLTLLALRKFNGNRFEGPRTEGALKDFAKELLYDVLCIEGNKGVLPDVFVQLVD